jgi:hypothetical protein
MEVKDAFGKPIKEGDYILYATNAERGSGMIREYIVTRVEPYEETSWSSRWSEEKQNWEWGHYPHVTGRVLVRPIVRKQQEAWPRSGKEVRLNRPERIIVITGVDLARRYAEPEVAVGN